METVVFTNGCFDLLHPGHIDLLERARALGTRLIVGINSDASVRAIKGSPRPFMTQEDRAKMLLGLRCVDEVRIFDEPTPQRLIEEIKPDVLVKGGDWDVSQIVGADFVTAGGGKAHSLPLLEGYSSSAIVESIQTADRRKCEMTDSSKEGSRIQTSLQGHLEVFSELLTGHARVIEECAEIIHSCFANGGKVMLCGNGGSAADAQHIAAEFVGRYEAERKGLASIALTTDTSALTALSNDYGYEKVFSRQVEALSRAGDVLVGISTSGTSPNVLAAIMKAREIGCKTIGLTGAGGKKLASLCDGAILVPSERVSRIQEAHITIGHLWCEYVDEKLGVAAQAG
jgi:D-sedoheptulose 7-phosphate isomerase